MSEIDWKAAGTARAMTGPQRGRHLKNKCGKNGIFDWVRFREEYGAREFANRIKRADPDSVVFINKTHTARFTGDLTWRVEFAINPNVNAYIMRRATIRQLREWGVSLS